MEHGCFGMQMQTDERKSVLVWGRYSMERPDLWSLETIASSGVALGGKQYIMLERGLPSRISLHLQAPPIFAVGTVTALHHLPNRPRTLKVNTRM
jgi:hypothetical protein